jgi:hypothetical protein
MEHRWNEIDGGKPKYSGKNLSQCYFVHHKSHMDWLGSNPGLRSYRRLLSALSHRTAHPPLWVTHIWSITMMFCQNLDSALESQKNMVTEWAHSQGRMVSNQEADKFRRFCNQL